MHVKKFVFKFIDHDTTNTTIYEIAIHSGKNIEWAHNEGDIGGYTQWLLDETNKEFNIKDYIDRFIKNNFLGQKNAEANLNEKYSPRKDLLVFGDYKLKKMNEKMESETVNVDSKNTTNIIFRHICSMEKTKYKYTRGEHPANWTKIFDYTKTQHHFIFKETGNSMEKNLALKLVNEFDVEPEKLISYNKPQNLTDNKSRNSGIERQSQQKNTMDNSRKIITQDFKIMRNRAMINQPGTRERADAVAPRNRTTDSQQIANAPTVGLRQEGTNQGSSNPMQTMGPINQTSKPILQNPAISTNTGTADIEPGRRRSNDITLQNHQGLNMKGGYENKYRVYKQKYLQLKEQLA